MLSDIKPNLIDLLQNRTETEKLQYENISAFDLKILNITELVKKASWENMDK